MSRELFLPNEIVEMILRNLKGKDMYRCRRVCKQWLSVVERLAAEDGYWENLLLTNHKDIYKDALWKSGLSHKSLYKSLCLWSKVTKAKITCTEFLTRRFLGHFQVLPNRVIGVPSFKKDGNVEDMHFEGFDRIKYFNLKTGKYKTRIVGETFSTYAENDHLIVVVDDNTSGPQYMTVIPKADKTNTSNQIKLSFSFLLLDKSVYYLDTFRDIVRLSMVNNDGVLQWQLCSFETEYNIMPVSFSYIDGFVNYLTEDGVIYVSNGDEFAPVYSVEGKRYNNILHKLRCYNFMPDNSHDGSPWSLIYEDRPPRKITRMGIQTIVSHGDVVFLISFAQIYIYYSPIFCGPFDLYNAKPDRICDLSELCGSKVRNITHLAVIEIEDGHMLVATTIDQKIFLLNILHYITEDLEERKVDKCKLKCINPIQNNPSTSQCKKPATSCSATSPKIAKRKNSKKRSTRPKRKCTSKAKKGT